MKPKSPFTQPFEQLPHELPIYPLENALLPGGALPLTLDQPHHLRMFLDVLKTDQLIGMVQPRGHDPDGEIYRVGCAGRIRQYRERGDGRLNVMLNGVCRYRVVEELPRSNGYRRVIADWSGFEQDYTTEDIDLQDINLLKVRLRGYFKRHQMQIDWQALDKLHIEEVINNLVLVLNFSVDSKQRLLEAPSVLQRLHLFADLLDEKSAPFVATQPETQRVN
jgi:hypothetical protein